VKIEYCPTEQVIAE